MRFLSDEWVAAAGTSSVPAVDGGFSGRVQHAVTGGPEDDVKFVVTWTDGRPTSAEVGVDKDAEVSLTLPFADAVGVAKGDLDLNTLFMRGQMKVAGSTGTLLQFLAATQGPALVDELSARAEDTDFA
ncbi:MAG: SCP2 sterol-binding domain-containing protein [Aquihabitans sp.]